MASTMGCGGPLTILRPTCLLSLLLFICRHVMASSAAVQPVSMVSSYDWFGYDGQWGALYVSVGDNQQIFAVFPNTAGVDTLVIDEAGGCHGVETSDCASQRGGLFQSNASVTWKPDGIRQASFNGIGVTNVDANYGVDFIGFNFNWSDAPNAGPNNVSSSVGLVNSTSSWMGYFGLGLDRSDLSDLNTDTIMESVWDNRSIAPSCSYGYTAGASYRLKGAPASLTIGGYDQLRFEPNPVSFKLSLQGWPVVSLSSVEVLSVDKDNNSTLTSLLEASIGSYFTLDSSTSYIWLPQSACDMFSQALNLTYNDTLGLYLYPDGVHDYLTSANISFTFALSDTETSSNTVNITLPFSAFDQTISYPYPNFYPENMSDVLSYFPIKKATNTNDYRIGRVFFQEAYIIVDYERSNFFIYQASFDESIMSDTNIITIDPPPDSTYPDKTPKHLSQGAKAGIVVGSVSAFALILALLWWFFFRNRYQLSVRLRETSPNDSKYELPIDCDRNIVPRRWRNRGRSRSQFELEGDNMQPSELSATQFVHELPGSIPGITDEQPSISVPKPNVRRSAMSTASSTVSLSSAARMSESSDDGSFDEEELVSPQSTSRPNSRPSSIAKYHFPTTDETAETNYENDTEVNQETQTRPTQQSQPGEIVLGPSLATYASKRRSQS